MPRAALVLSAALVLLATTPANTAEPFYVGRWRITSAVVAPWSGPALPPDRQQMAALQGKTLVIRPDRIAGPRALACRGPRYEVVDATADLLFEGELAEPLRYAAPLDPDRLAAGLGFRGKSWKTLETNCANELQLHFLDPGRAAVGLNNVVYFLDKQ